MTNAQQPASLLDPLRSRPDVVQANDTAAVLIQELRTVVDRLASEDQEDDTVGLTVRAHGIVAELEASYTGLRGELLFAPELTALKGTAAARTAAVDAVTATSKRYVDEARSIIKMLSRGVCVVGSLSARPEVVEAISEARRMASEVSASYHALGELPAIRMPDTANTVADVRIAQRVLRTVTARRFKVHEELSDFRTFEPAVAQLLTTVKGLLHFDETLSSAEGTAAAKTAAIAAAVAPIQQSLEELKRTTRYLQDEIRALDKAQDAVQTTGFLGKHSEFLTR